MLFYWNFLKVDEDAAIYDVLFLVYFLYFVLDMIPRDDVAKCLTIVAIHIISFRLFSMYTSH